MLLLYMGTFRPVSWCRGTRPASARALSKVYEHPTVHQPESAVRKCLDILKKPTLSSCQYSAQSGVSSSTSLPFLYLQHQRPSLYIMTSF